MHAYSLVSSANSLLQDSTSWGRSFIYVRKRTGPKTLPCGTPLLTTLHGDLLLPGALLSVLQKLSDPHWSMPHAPGHLTPKWTHKPLRGYSERQPGLSQVITGITPASLQCSTDLSGTRWRPEGAFEIPQCFFKIFHGYVNISLPPIITAADNQTRCLHYYKKLRVIP